MIISHLVSEHSASSLYKYFLGESKSKTENFFSLKLGSFHVTMDKLYKRGTGKHARW